MTKFRRKILGEGAWVFSGHFLRVIGSLVGIRLFTQYVHPDIYGEIALLLGVLALTQQVFCTPVLIAALRFHSELGERTDRLRKIIRRPVFIGIVISIILVLTGGAAWSYLEGIPYAAFIIICALLIIEVLRMREVNFFLAVRRQRPIAVATVLEAWGRPFGAIAIVLLIGASVQAVLLGYFAAEGAVLVGLLLLARKGMKSREDAPPEDAKEKEKSLDLSGALMRYALPLAPLAAVNWISGMSDRYIVAGFTSAADVGIYAATYNLIATPFLMVQGIVRLTLLPLQFQAASAGNRHLERKTFRVWLFTTIVVCTAGFVATCFLNEIIAKYLLAEQYRSGAKLMPWLAGGNVLFSISLVFRSRFLTLKRTGALLLVNIIGAAAAVGVTVPMVMNYGLTGAAWACPIYFCVLLIANIIVARSFSSPERIPD